MQPLQRRCSNELYRALGVGKTSTQPEIKKAYHKAALRCHPDKTGGETTEEFKLIQEAHAILMDDERRKVYDTFGREGMKHFGDSEMGSAMAATMASNPLLMKFAGFIMFIASLLILIFMCLVVVKIDKKKSWTWAAIFTPIWLFLVVLIPALIAQLVQTVQEKEWRNLFGILTLTMFIITIICVNLGLDSKMDWHDVFAPIFMLLIFLTANAARSLLPKSYERLLQVSQIENWEERPGYIRYLVIGVFEIVCTWSQVLLLYFRIGHNALGGTSFWVIFLPAIIRTCLPAMVGFSAALCCNPNEEASTKDKVFQAIAILFSAAFSAYTVLMVAAKCEQDYNTHHPSTHINAGECCIMLFLSNAFAILASCGACLSNAGEIEDEEFPSPDGGESGHGTFTPPGETVAASKPTPAEEASLLSNEGID